MGESGNDTPKPLFRPLRAAKLPLRPSRLSGLPTATIICIADRFFARIPLQADRYDSRFFLGIGSVLGFSLLSYWSLTTYWDVKWFAGEDGASEWWSVATYSASSILATVSGWSLARLGHPRIGSAHILFAVVLIVGALEEISWGQRLIGWSTPDLLASLNEQDETTLHNVGGFDRVFYTGFLVASSLALLGALVRAVLHRKGRVTTADFLLPSLVLAPALLMIIIWIIGGQSFPGNVARMLMIHFDAGPVGSEVPEVLMGLCLCLYTFTNLRRTASIRRNRIRARESQGSDY